MPLNPGNEDCSDGLAKDLHNFFIEELGASDTVKNPEIDPITGEVIRENIQETNVKRLCYGLARILIDHIIHNMEIYGVEVEIKDVSTKVNTQTTCPAGSGTGVGTGSGTATGQQSGTGRAK